MSETQLRVVLDTNILIKACRHESPDCIALIWEFYKRPHLSIVLDDDDKDVILGEYQRNLHDNEMYQKWYTTMKYTKDAVAGQISRVSGKLSNSIKKALINKGFHELTDHVFVAVALYTDKELITEDSDYGKGKEEKANMPEKQQVLSYLTQQLHLHVMDSPEGLAYLRAYEPQ